jgi:hypothetical protein
MIRLKIFLQKHYAKSSAPLNSPSYKINQLQERRFKEFHQPFNNALKDINQLILKASTINELKQELGQCSRFKTLLIFACEWQGL